MKKYKAFWYEVEEGGVFAIRIYYNGICATELETCCYDDVLPIVKEWVDAEGFEWLGVE